jgi:hypothetical protein
MKVIALVSGGKVVYRTHDPLPYNLMGFIRVRKMLCSGRGYTFVSQLTIIFTSFIDSALQWKRVQVSVCITIYLNFYFIDSATP